MKKVWFQLHWMLGISAGLVLAVMGITGAVLAYEDGIMRLINSGVITVKAEAGKTLSPAELYARLAEADPDRKINSVTVEASPTDAARVNFVSENPKNKRGETRYVNPYSGEVLPKPQGEKFFKLVEDIHRKLAAGDTGKLITGISALVLVFLALSGLYLRWPRQARKLRSWLALDWKLKGRSFLWNLHAVAGTLVLLFYLWLPLTGLYWSFDWYKNGLYAITGAEPPPAQREGGDNAGKAEGKGEGKQQKPEGDAEKREPKMADANKSVEAADTATPPGHEGHKHEHRNGREVNEAAGAAPEANKADVVAAEQGAKPEGERKPNPARGLEKSWALFQQNVPAWSSATFKVGGGKGKPVEVTYLDANPPHDRARNTLKLNLKEGAVVEHKRYADKPLADQMLGSMLPLHKGTFFGWPVQLLIFLAALAMPLFFVTGWMLYLKRRAQAKAALAAQQAAGGQVQGAGESWLIAFASQSGYAEQLAWSTAGSLRAGGAVVNVQALDRIAAKDLERAERALFVVSTFGQGEPPDNARRFARQVLSNSLPLPHLRFGLLALGDSSYQTFCGFGRRLQEWLGAQGAQPLFAPVEMDRGDTAAFQQWHERLGASANVVLGGMVSMEPVYEDWTLNGRRCLNPGSQGEPAFHVAFARREGVSWKAGDIAEILPEQAPARVAEFLAALGIEKNRVVDDGGESLTIAQALARRELPASVDGLQGLALPALLAKFKPLTGREFSIASIPEDGELQLLVRQSRYEGGRIGIGAGWLTEYAKPGSRLRLRIRSNASFHVPADDRPLLLIGNGTGLAGLLSLIRARALAGQHRNWLLFGERSAAHDFFHQEQVERWQQAGVLARVDLAFSRDQAERVYVQHLLVQAADAVRDYVEQGASIYICGSLRGMAPAVEEALVQILGEAALDQLNAEGRYRRDVY